jgi:hypothetical protein
MPLDWFLGILRDPGASVERRDWAASMAAPYTHAKLAVVEQKVEQSAVVRVLSGTELEELRERAAREVDEAFKEWQPPNTTKTIEHQPSQSQSSEPEPPHRPAEDYVRDGVVEPASDDVVQLKDRYRPPRPPYSSVGH